MPNTKRAIKRATKQLTTAATIRKRDWAKRPI